MTNYKFKGIVLPTHVLFSDSFKYSFIPNGASNRTIIKSVTINNFVDIDLQTDIEWNVLDLRNIVIRVMRDRLNMIDFIHGTMRDFQLDSVRNDDIKLNSHFTMVYDEIAKRRPDIDFQSEIQNLQRISSGASGRLVMRCLGDLSSAMKDPDDTAFFCYRAIESLSQHAADRRGIQKDSPARWPVFREMARCTETDIRSIKIDADLLRHGGISADTSVHPLEILLKTWTIVESYISSLTEPVAPLVEGAPQRCEHACST